MAFFEKRITSCFKKCGNLHLEVREMKKQANSSDMGQELKSEIKVKAATGLRIAK
jgi:hypothetical protein